MSCVNKSSKEFKDLASKHGISANALELITHKYWLEIGSEENFPTDVYIQAQLGNNSYQENITSVRKLWDESYSSPKEYNSFEEVDKAYNEALKYFPKGAVVYYKNDKGRYILSVRKPVEKTPATAYDFFSDEYNSAKKLNLQINEGENYTIDKVEELFNKFNTDRTSQFLADKVFKLAKDLGLQISFNSSLPAAGRYTNNNTIVYNKRYFEADLNNDRKPDILLHEVIHAITMYALSDQTANWSRSKDLEDFRNTINDIYGKVRYNDALKGERGIKDIKEFVAELGNPIFRRKLQSIDNRSFWQKIVDAVKNLLGIHTSSTYYGRMINTLDKAINAFDIDSYMKYNGIKQSLQRGYNDHRVETKDMTEVELKSTVKNAITDSAPKMKENGTKVSVLSDADRSALSYVDTMSKDELSKEVGLIKQEYSDYDILNAMRGIEPSKKGKHTFTFNDGTTVNVPFKPNEQQAHALNVMDEFIKSDETSMTLSGYAGTGKTSLMEILAKKATKDGVPIKFSASTNKAAAVLKSKVSKIGYTADTLNKVFGISVEVDSSKPYDAKNLVTKLKDAQVWWGTTVIIDEASMINEKNYKILTDIAKENGLKIIFVGDKAQLAPVKENKISPVFRSTNTKCVELTKVERTDDNAILKEATNLRNNQPLSMESSFNDEGKGVAFTKDNQTASDVIKYYVGQIKNNPDSFKILAYTNAAVANYNERVRRLLGYQGETPNVGEPMMGYANWGYDYRRKTYQFINSEAYTVTKVDAPKQVSFNIQGNNIKLTIIPITLKDSLGESRTFNYIDIKGNAANRETVAFLGALKNKLWAKAMSVSKYARIPYYKTINQIDEYLFVNDDIKEGGRTLVAKVIDFGYAMTVHKSQGSTFTNVLMDENDISKARNAVEESFNPVATVDLGNAGHEVTSNDHLDSVDEIDLGEDFSNVKQKPTNTDTANMFQQLNYVAMSRATNTVTVLTDGAKKEDSPLNHIKEKGAEKPVQETQRPVAPVTPEKPREYYTGNIAPDAETIFVFGSNPEGRHGAGAAKIAHDEFGAQYGVGEGLTGNAYALPTKDLRVRENKGLKSISPERITESIKKMYAVARQHPDKLFKVAYRNTSNASLNGYTGYEMIDMFNKAGKVPSNVQFSEEWYKTGLLKPIETTQSTTSKDKFIVNESVFGDKNAVRDSTTIITKDIAQAMALYKSGKIGVKEFIKRIHPTNTWMHEHAEKNYADKFVNQHGWVLSENNVSTSFTPLKDYITPQLLEHIKYIGIDVNDRAAIEKYIEEHPQWAFEIQQAINNMPKDYSELQQAQSEYDSTIKELIEAEKALHSKSYESTQKTSDGSIKIKQYEDQRSDNSIYISSGENVFDSVGLSIEANIGKNSIGGSLIFPSENALNKESNFVKLDNPIKSNYTGILKTVLNYFIKNGKNRPLSEWQLYTSDNTNYKSKIDTLSKILGINVSPYFQFEAKEVTREGLSGYQKEIFERVVIDAEGLLKALPTLQSTKQFSEIEKALEVSNADKTNYQLKLNALHNKYRTLDKQREEQWNKIQELKDNIRRKEAEESDLPFFKTSSGEIYGFVTPDGRMFLDETKINPEHPIHEYTHLWDRALMKVNPQLWNRGVELMKKTSLWKTIEEDANYGAIWKAQKLSQEEIDNRIASEVHARFVGEGGAKLLENLAKKEGQKGIIAKLKNWILEAWKSLKATFSDWSEDEINKLTLKDFNHMTMRDFVEEINPNTINSMQGSYSESSKAPVINKTKLLTFYSGGAKGSDTYWGNATNRIGGKTIHYRPTDYDKLSKENKDRIEKEYNEVISYLGKHPSNATGYIGKLLRRDLLQADSASAIFAVGHLDNNGLVAGGTGYATTRGIIRGIPVHLYNQETKSWMIWDANQKKFVNEPQPTLVNNAALIGTRGLNTDGQKAIDDVINAYQEAINDKGTRSYNSILNITQNASGRLGSLDKTDEDSFNSAKETLRKADATPKEIEEATKTLNDIYERKNKEIQTIFKDVSDLTGAKFSIVEAAGSWQGGGEYSFKIKVEAPTKEAYDNTMLAVSYVAEAARQDAFVENLGEADRKDVSQNSLLEGQQTPNITIPFSHSLSEREMALVQGTFLENSTDELPLDATITKDEISFNLPAWVLEDTDDNGEKKDNATRYKEYKELYDKWNDKIIEIINNNKDGRLKGIYRQEAKRTYQKNRLQGCDSYGEGEKTRTYNDYRNNLLSGQRGNGTNASQSKGVGRQTTLTDEEGQVIKANAEKLFGLEEDNIQPTIEGIPSTDDAPSTSHTLSLPSYKYFNDLQEDTTVDASWKDDLLKELDSQLSTDNTTEQNNEIINKMNDILKASTEDDLKGEQSSKKQAEIQHDLDEYDKLNKQFDNLLEGNFADKENGNIKDLDIKFKASEIRHVAELVGNYLSDIITKLQTEPDAASELFDELQFDRRVDFTTMTRREIASTIGINNIIARAKHGFAPENGVLPYDNVDTLAKAQLVEENWDALMLLASDVFALNEGFGIKRDYEHSSFEINNEDNQIAYDDFNGYQDEDSTNETEGDSQEKWQVDSMTIDVLNSMSALVRQRLHNCFILDENGERQVDKDWKLPLRVNPRKATNSILRWVQGSTSLDDMINKLDAKQKDNPWVQQLVQSLSDKTGKETDFQSQFYGVFCKHFQPYSIVLLDKGKYGSIPVNNHPALTEAMNSIVATYRIGEHPLFNINGKINESLLGNENTTNEKADFNLNQAFANLKTIVARLNHKEEFDADMSKEATKWITGVYRVLGYNVTEDMVSDILDADKVRYLTDKLRYIVDDLGRALKQQKKNVGNPKAKKYQPFTYGAEYNVRGSISNFLSPITESLEDTAISAFYDSGKMYQSYVTPSFMTKLMIKFKNLKGQNFEDFIMNEYGNSEWFRDPKGGLIIGKGWKNEMLRLLATDENTRNIFDFKVELNFNKHNYMRNMSDSEYTLSLITEYFSESSETNNLTPAYFRMPMQSNKPSSEFFKFYSYRGSEYKNAIVRNLYTMFLQELGRIQTVRMRNLSKDDPRFIKNFDSNGRKFNFLPFLNTYLEDTNISARTLLRDEDGRVSTDNERLAKLLQRKVEGLEETKLTAEEETELKSLVTKAIRNYMEARANEILDRWESSGIVEAARNIKNIVPHEDLLKTDKDENKNEYVRQSLENYIWNDYLATKNILQLTVGDTAFYKDAEDLQKRLAQLHAPGIRGNINATDYEGHRVSDGKYRTLVLRDFDNFISSIIDNISEVFDRMIERAPENQKNQWRALKESLVGEHGEYRKINVTDAQGYSSPSSYRKKAFIFGKWSRHAEDIYQKLLKGEYTFSDLKTAFQPLKPFVYTHLEKNLGVDNAPIHTMHVPFQAKNSEYLLIMADALIKGEQMKSGNLSRPNLLSAIYRVMEDSEKINPTKGIDTVQFESAIKSGLQGALDIHQFSDTKGGEDAAYTFMMNQVYKMDDKGQRTNEYNTNTFVHEASYDDYCLQQEVPEHFKNHSQAHGSQIRAITPSDLDEYKDPNADHNDENNIVYYEWTEPDGTKRRLTASEFRKEYEDTIAANIEQDLNKLYEEFHLNSQDKRERNIALSKVLQREILSSPRYGVDLLQACSVDKTTGEFRIPKGDPIQAKRIEQLINSIIKNRVNKQKIAGGPIVQVTNFGTSKQLHIRFNDRQGGLLKTKEEFNADDSLKKEYGNYSKYTKERQAGIAYFEVYIPMWSDELYNKFVDENGNIDVDAIEATSPELLKMISYRIPTEDKYSTAPMKAVGFMPREAGDAIMLPYELTTIDDSDFDVDKRYVMRKDLQIVSKPKGQIFKKMFNQVVESYKSSHDGKIDSDHKTALSDLVNTFIDDRNRGKYKNAVINFMGHPVKADSIMNYLNSIYRKVAYTVKMPTDRQYRDNKIIDMTWAVLTNEMTADKILNPGGFEKVAKTGYKIAAYKAVGKEGKSWNSLQGMTEDELKDLSYTSKDLSWVDTQIQFYKQNSATSSMIGIFAVNKVAHAILESDDIYIDVNEICGKEPFTIADTTFDSRMRIDSKLDSEGNLIGKTEGSLVSASADGVKKPVLDLMNVNTTTANVLNTLLRMGMPFDDAALFMSQDSITRLLREYNNRSLTNYVSLQSVISEFMDKFDKENHVTDDSNIKTEELSRQELIEGLLDTDHKVIDYKVMLALQKLLALGQALRNPTFATRFNSISSAVGPLIIDNLIMQHKIDQFKDSATEDGTHFYDKDGFNVDIDDVFYNHPILKQFSKTLDVANELFKDMPAGSEQFKNVLDNLPEYISDKIYNDKKLLSQLSDFYQSYLLVASGLVDSSQLKDIINNFPKEFNDKNYKEKYKDNELIQAIKLNVSRKTDRPYLEIKTTGMDAPDKEALSSAWIDLHREDPELSKKLFIYNFFRGGIGFSPKTFMSLVPMFVKEHMNTTKADGSTISYLDTFRNMPDVNPDIVIDQFIRNNWDNNKLVPWKGGKGTKYVFNYKNGLLTVNKNDLSGLEGAKYIKTKGNGRTNLWRLISNDENSAKYQLVKPLGDNNEYIEMSTSEIDKPISETLNVEEDNNPSSLSEKGSTEDSTDKVKDVKTDKDNEYSMSNLADLIMKQNPRFDKNEAVDKIEDIKKDIKSYRKFLINVFKHKGLNLNENQAMEEFNKYC